MDKTELFGELRYKLNLWSDTLDSLHDLERADELMICGGAYEEYETNAAGRIRQAQETLEKLKEFLEEQIENDIKNFESKGG